MRVSSRYKLYSKPMQAKYMYEITREDVNLISLQEILDCHQVGKLVSMMVNSQNNVLEICIDWRKGSGCYYSLLQGGLHQRLHVRIPETNIWIYKC